MLDREIRALMPVIPRGKRAFLFGLLFAVLIASACEPPRAQRFIQQPARRIVSLLPAATDVLLALNAADCLVGRTDYDTAASVASIASFGRTLSPSVEAVLALRPDLVILPRFLGRGNPTEALLQSQRVAVLSPRLHAISDLYALIDSIGARLGRNGTAAALNESIRTSLARVRAGAAADSPSVLYLIWHEPPTVAGRGSYIDELITIAGGRNVMADLQHPWPQISLESLVGRDPDYLVLPVGRGHPVHADRLAQHPGWRQVAAVREGRVIEVDGDLFSQLGPHIVEAAGILARELSSAGAAR